MSTIIKLVQGSPEWHQHRLHHRNASETPAVLQLSPYLTANELWQIKTGRTPQPEVTAAMAHGSSMEPQAREAYERETVFVMEPLVMVDGEYSASLDGITLDGRLICEIKCQKSKDSKIPDDERWPENRGDEHVDGGFLIWPVLLLTLGVILFLSRWL